MSQQMWILRMIIGLPSSLNVIYFWSLFYALMQLHQTRKTNPYLSPLVFECPFCVGVLLSCSTLSDHSVLTLQDYSLRCIRASQGNNSQRTGRSQVVMLHALILEDLFYFWLIRHTEELKWLCQKHCTVTSMAWPLMNDKQSLLYHEVRVIVVNYYHQMC